MQLVVLGAHRSETSTLVRLLARSGAFVVDEDRSQDGPGADISAACDVLLRTAGFDWWRVSGFSVDAIPSTVRARGVVQLRAAIRELDAHRPWVVDDPRVSLLLPLVLPLLDAPVCIHVARDPIEVAQSMRLDHGITMAVALALWEVYCVHALRGSTPVPRILVRHGWLVSDPQRFSRLVDDLAGAGVYGLRQPGEAEVAAVLGTASHLCGPEPPARRSWLSAQQELLASAFDEGRLLDASELGAVSETALATLRGFEHERALHDRIDDLVRRSVELTASVEAGRSGEERSRTDAVETLEAVEDKLGAIARSKSWRVALRLAGVRRRLQHRPQPAAGTLLDQSLSHVRRTRRALASSGRPDVPPAADRDSGAGSLAMPEGWVIDDTSRRRLEAQLARAGPDVVGVVAGRVPLPPGTSYRVVAEHRTSRPPSDARPLTDRAFDGAVLARTGASVVVDDTGVTVADGTVLVDPGAVVHDPWQPIEGLAPASVLGRPPDLDRPVVLFLGLNEDPYLADWVRSTVNALVRRDVEGRIAVLAPTEGLHLTQPCSPTVESVVALVPDVVVVLDVEASERAAAWLDLGSRGAFIELTEDTTRDVELVSASGAPAGGRLRARIGRGVRPDDLAHLTRELAAGPDEWGLRPVAVARRRGRDR